MTFKMYRELCREFPQRSDQGPFSRTFLFKIRKCCDFGSFTEYQTTVLCRNIQGLADLVFFTSITNEKSRQLNGKSLNLFVVLYLNFFISLKIRNIIFELCVCVNEIVFYVLCM